MSETYVTYRVWGGCRAPLNLEYDGRLIGEIARELTVDRDALLELADEMDSAGEDGLLVRDSDLMAWTRRIRKALGVQDA